MKKKFPASEAAPADELRIDGLHLSATVGVDPGERAAPRELVAHLALETDLAAAAASDDLRDTTDWAALAAGLRATAAARPWRLVESLAAALAERALAEPRVRRVRIRVDKPGAMPGVDRFSVVLVRARGADGGVRAAGAGAS